MVDKSIGELVAAAQINDNDLFVLEQNGEAKKLLGNVLKQNIGSGSNRNLLDNPWFTVNQRGITSGQTITNAYCFDRWRVGNILTLTFDDDAITLTPNGTYYGEFAQIFEQNLIRLLVGKTVTFSAWLKGHGYFTGYGQEEFNYSDWTLFTRVFTITTTPWTRIGVRTYDANSVVQIKCGVKLELGSVSTLANDTEPNYETELAKCQKYYNCLGKTSSYNAVIPFSVNGAGTTFAMLLPFQMRDGATTVNVKGTLYLKGSTGGLGTISFSGTESWTVTQNKPFLVCHTSKATTGGIGGVAAADNLELYVSADL